MSNTAITKALVWAGAAMGATALLVMLGTPLRASAEDEPRPSDHVPPDSMRLTVPLGDLMPEPAPVRLNGSSANYDFHLSLSPRIDVDRARLTLRLASSIALMQDRSSLRISLNGATIGQIALQPVGAQTEHEIELPPLLLVPGYNRVSIAAAQHYTLSCEDPQAPELWTEIDTRASTIEFEARARRVAPTLAELDALMGAAIGNPRRHVIATAGAPDDALMTAGARAAESIGLRLQYLAPHIRHERLPIDDFPALDPARWPDSDIVLLGTRDQLAPYLSDAERRAITAAYLSVRPVGPASSTMLLVVSGTTPREVARAAQALGRLDLPRADSSSALISGPDLPVSLRRVERTLVAPGSERTLADLGYRTRTVRGYNRERIDVRFDLPADFYVADRENIELALDFAYGANLRADSVLNVLLNGNFQQAIPLANAQGAALRDYRISLPMRSFARGPNVITFEPVMVPTITGECVAVEDRNLALTLYDRSMLRVPAASHYAEIPDLALFATTGFPYAQPSAWLQGGVTAAPVTMVTVADNDSVSLAAAWTFLAKLAQAAGVSLPELSLGTRVAPGTEHQLWIGAWNALDPVLRAAAPFSGDATATTRVHAAAPAPAPEMGALTRWLGTWVRPDVPEPRAAALRLQLNASDMLQDHGVLMAFQSPHAAGRAQTIVSAATPELLRARVDALVQPEIWNQLDGDIVLWSDIGREVHRERAAAGFMLGDPGYRDVFRYHVAQRPWLLIVAVFGLLLIAALLVHQLLNRRTRRHHDDSVTPAL